MRTLTRFLAGSLAVVTLAACQDVTRPNSGNQGEPISPDLHASNDGGSESEGDRTECVGTLTGMFDRVVVPRGAFCFLVGSIVRHDVVALEDAVLAVFDTQIGGDVIGRGADVVNTGRITVGGSIHVRNGGPHPTFTEVAICGADVKGNVFVREMTGTVSVDSDFCGSPNTVREGNIMVVQNVIPLNERLSVSRNAVLQAHVRVLENEGSGQKFVQLNTIAGMLTCEGNEPPVVGGPNVARSTRGQCF